MPVNPERIRLELASTMNVSALSDSRRRTLWRIFNELILEIVQRQDEQRDSALMEHANSAECPQVMSGFWHHCKGHYLPVGEVNPDSDALEARTAQLDRATMRWARAVREANPHITFLYAVADVNTFRHAYGLPMFRDESEVMSP